MQKLFIPILLGTAREGRETEKVARYVFDEIKKLDIFDTQFVDVKDFLFRKTTEDKKVTKTWRDIMTKADGLIIVSPEYNRSIPGELKILIDSLDEEYIKKPVAVIGSSSGKVGGGRMAENILPTLITLGMIPIYPAILFPTVQDLFDSNQNIKDGSYENKISTMAHEILKLGEVLKIFRENNK